jgi:hypothetical protein
MIHSTLRHLVFALKSHSAFVILICMVSIGLLPSCLNELNTQPCRIAGNTLTDTEVIASLNS